MASNIEITEVIRSLRPNSEWIVAAGQIQWLDDTTTQPTEEEINAEIARLQAEKDATEYQRLREAAYNERGATISALVVAQQEALEGDETALNELKQIRAEVKAQFPKPE